MISIYITIVNVDIDIRNEWMIPAQIFLIANWARIYVFKKDWQGYLVFTTKCFLKYRPPQISNDYPPMCCVFISCVQCLFVLRPDSFDLLFLRSFPDPFERVERDKIKIKGKRGKNLHENSLIWGHKILFSWALQGPYCVHPRHLLVLHFEIS